MAEVYIAARRESLLRTQNVDGGWGYFPGKASWLEPTAYAVLALHGNEKSPEAIQRALRLIKSWQLPDGSWRPGSQVQDGTWVTALAVTVCGVENILDAPFSRGLGYLLQTIGAETRTFARVMRWFGLGEVEFDVDHTGWPWRGGTSSWVEPTVHTLIALKRARRLVNDSRIGQRIRSGEQMLLGRQCHDGGWNHGARRAFQIDLPSYPETTGLGLLGLQGRKEGQGVVTVARRLLESADGPLAKAWITIALRVWGESVAPPDPGAKPGRDTMLNALQAMAHPAGNYGLFNTGASS